jgi:hypothetical protein
MPEPIVPAPITAMLLMSLIALKLHEDEEREAMVFSR